MTDMDSTRRFPRSPRALACRDKIKALLDKNPMMSLNQIAKEARITPRAAKMYCDEIHNARNNE